MAKRRTYLSIRKAAEKYRIGYERLWRLVNDDTFTRIRFSTSPKARIFLWKDELDAFALGGIDAVRALRSAGADAAVGGEGGAA